MRTNELSTITDRHRGMIEDILGEIVDERERQNKKWDTSNWGNWNPPSGNKLGILVEEVGEVATALIDNEPIENLRAELIQVAAVAMQWVEHIDSLS